MKTKLITWNCVAETITLRWQLKFKAGNQMKYAAIGTTGIDLAVFIAIYY